MKTGTVTEREHAAFLMMWLEKHLLCGRAAGPSTNTQALAEALLSGASVPLGKHLLGAAYHMLHQISVKLSQGEPIGNPGGPWWFINLWLNLYMSKISQQRVEHMTFPNIESAENPTVRRRCTSFGEATSAFSGCSYSATKVAEYFRCFYNGFSEDATSWFPYQRDDPIFELPSCFDSTTGRFDEDLTDELIKPRVLPANFFSGKDAPTYEFYNPSVVAQQFGLGQMPIGIYFISHMQFDTRLQHH